MALAEAVEWMSAADTMLQHPDTWMKCWPEQSDRQHLREIWWKVNEQVDKFFMRLDPSNRQIIIKLARHNGLYPHLSRKAVNIEQMLQHILFIDNWLTYSTMEELFGNTQYWPTLTEFGPYRLWRSLSDSEKSKLEDWYDVAARH